MLAFHGRHAFALGTLIALVRSMILARGGLVGWRRGGIKAVWVGVQTPKAVGWAIYAVGFAVWLFGYLSAGHAPLFDWNATPPWWISSFIPNLEAEIGLALMFASILPTLPWPRLFPFALFLILAAITLAWWGFLAWLIWNVIWGQSRGAA